MSSGAVLLLLLLVGGGGSHLSFSAHTSPQICILIFPTHISTLLSLQTVAERARQEVTFWKNQLDHAVEEKNALLDRYTALYRHAFELEQYAGQLGNENNELRHVLEQTLQDERRVQVSAATAGAGSGAAGGSQLRSSLTGLPSPVSPQGSTTPLVSRQQQQLQKDISAAVGLGGHASACPFEQLAVMMWLDRVEAQRIGLDRKEEYQLRLTAECVRQHLLVLFTAGSASIPQEIWSARASM